MKEKIYFYFASPHSFKYPFYVNLIFRKNNGSFECRKDNSKWIEVKDYTYYGEPVSCIIPAQSLEYSFLLNLLESENHDNVFGAINYMLRNYRERFLSDLKSSKSCCANLDILHRYFVEEI